MRKFIVLMLLAMVSTGATADWVKIGSLSSLGGYDVHVDPATISKVGNLVRMWDIMDFKTLQVAGSSRYLSIKRQLEYGCK